MVHFVAPFVTAAIFSGLASAAPVPNVWAAPAPWAPVAPPVHVPAPPAHVPAPPAHVPEPPAHVPAPPAHVPAPPAHVPEPPKHETSTAYTRSHPVYNVTPPHLTSTIVHYIPTSTSTHVVPAHPTTTSKHVTSSTQKHVVSSTQKHEQPTTSSRHPEPSSYHEPSYSSSSSKHEQYSTSSSRHPEPSSYHEPSYSSSSSKHEQYSTSSSRHPEPSSSTYKYEEYSTSSRHPEPSTYESHPQSSYTYGHSTSTTEEHKPDSTPVYESKAQYQPGKSVKYEYESPSTKTYESKPETTQKYTTSPQYTNPKSPEQNNVDNDSDDVSSSQPTLIAEDVSSSQPAGISGDVSSSQPTGIAGDSSQLTGVADSAPVYESYSAYASGTATYSSWASYATASYSAPAWGSGAYAVQDCVSQCKNKAGLTENKPTPVVQGASAGGATHTVIVAPSAGVLRYVPFAVNASVGDVVLFKWKGSNHTVSKSSALQPCTPLQDASRFTSGRQNTTFEYTQVVNSTEPTYFYCGVGEHCEKGMFGILNPPSAFGAASSVGKWAPEQAKNDSILASEWSYTNNAIRGTQAAGWGDNIDLAALPEWAQLAAVENVMYTRTAFAANPEVFSGNSTSPSLSGLGSNPLAVPVDVKIAAAAALNNAGATPAPAAPLTPVTAPATPGAPAAAPEFNNAQFANGAGALSANAGLVAIAALAVSFFAL